MPWYRSGTVAITAGQTSVVGTNIDFAANARVGDAFQGPDGRWYEVANIASATVLSILPPYQGATVSSGGYGLAPMQGYVKDSADALRAIVNQYGAKLAALGTTGNYDILPVAKGGTGGATAADARAGLGLGSVATESTVPVAKGGTGGTTPTAARAGLGLGSAAIAQIVGDVQAGALMQYITNAVGEYWLYQNGQVISSQNVIVANLTGWNAGQGARYLNITASLPYAFVTTPKLFGQMVENDVSGRAAWFTTITGTSNSLSAWFGSNLNTSSNAGFSFNVLAVGRWK